MNLFKFNFFSKQSLIATQIIALQILRHVHFWHHLIDLVTACFRINQETIGGLPNKKKDLPLLIPQTDYCLSSSTLKKSLMDRFREKFSAEFGSKNDIFPTSPTK